jgi:uncharacterized repeat protein (TIGR02543 family)
MVSGGAMGAANMPDEPTRSEYAFGGWYTERDGGGTQFTASTPVSADITVYAKWNNTVKFDAGSGSPATQTRTVVSGGTVGFSNMPSDPTKTGNTFGGWYTATGGNGTQFTASTPLTANITVYAKWICTVTFNTDGGSPAAQTRTVNSGGAVGTSNMPSEPTRSGNTFGGWYTATGGNGTQFTASTPVTANITVYAKWICMVTFNADGGNPATQTRTMVSGGAMGAANMPDEPTRSEYAFGGWYTVQNGGGTQFTASTQVSADMPVYAKWMPAVSVPSGSSLEESLTWISNNAVEGGLYIITLKNNETIAPRTLSYNGKNVTVILVGSTSDRTVSLSANGSIFTVGSGVTLTLGANLTLRGRTDDTGSLVRVNSGGTLVMNTKSKISGNTASSGGGVYVNGGAFTMTGGEISGNAGGGVYVYSGTFTMYGGKITSNSGGGVGVYSFGTFIMDGGEISGNTASNYGGGVVLSGGVFTMNDGKISGNTASFGGGVYIYYGNLSLGVYQAGWFTMTGGEISGNTGGGVYVNVYNGGGFTKSGGGTIYGSDAASTLKNTATNNDGHAVYVYDGKKKRNTTAGAGVNMDSSKSGAAGGWE